MNANRTAEKFLSGPTGRKLLRQYSLDDVGLWKVEGEDDSPGDWGASSNIPVIDLISGSLRDAVEHAVANPRFWTYGAGGNITKVKTVVNNPERHANALRRKKELELALKLVNAELGEY